MLGLRHFIMLCNNAEYQKMDQGMSWCQLYDVQNEINILYKALAGPTHLHFIEWIGLTYFVNRKIS